MEVRQDKKVIHEGLVQRLVAGDGKASPEDRIRAFNNADLPEPLERLLVEVANAAGHVTNDGIDRAKTAGFNEDQIFELVVCAAVGAATRQYEAGLTALARSRSHDQGG
jgi:hypothetical protein